MTTALELLTEAGLSCANCRYWDRSKDGAVDEECSSIQTGVGFRMCHCPEVVFLAGVEWTDPRLKPIENEEWKKLLPLPKSAADVRDGSGYWACFNPGPAYCCIHHQLEVSNDREGA